MNTSRIFDIKTYAINDGPGIRITVFLKGCPLSCKWCHNPEGQSSEKQKMFSKSKCIACNECIEICDQDACFLTSEGVLTDKLMCILCSKCAKVCPTKATEISGELISVEDIMNRIKKESSLINESGGGVTFSGGEPLMHHKLLIQLLDECGKEGIHRCVDTTGFADIEFLLDVAKRTELFLYDIKMMDSETHKRYTGVSNEKILNNLKVLSETGANINIRIPLIEGINANEDNIKETALFISKLKGEKKVVNLLPYHNIAKNKYSKLAIDYDNGEMLEPSSKVLDNIKSIFNNYGINVEIGG